MRRRITALTVGVVALALVLSGFFTLVLVARAARQETRRDLVSQATDIATAADDPASFRVLANFSRTLQLEGVSRVTFTPRGGVVGELPSGISPVDLRTDLLDQGRIVSGVRGSLAYAVAPVRVPAGIGGGRGPGARPAPRLGLTAVVVTRRVDAGLRRGAAWFLLSAGVSLVVAWLLASRLGRRIARPLEAAESTTRRIAAGDLDARVEVPPATDGEVASLAGSINAMAEHLARSRGLERQFLLSVSHDLRTPLTSIRGFAEAIADGAAPDHERAAEVIAAESRRLERLVGDLLQLAKLDARRFSLDVRRTDAVEVASATAEAFRPEFDEAGVDLSVSASVSMEGAPGPLFASADPDRLAQVVANLVENAFKFATGRVVVSVESQGSAGELVAVVVSDDGPGIAPDELPRVFERLYQSHRAATRRAGSGLGLAIVAELVSAMGGSVAAESEGTGTRMVVRLPAWSSN